MSFIIKQCNINSHVDYLVFHKEYKLLTTIFKDQLGKTSFKKAYIEPDSCIEVSGPLPADTHSAYHDEIESQIRDELDINLYGKSNESELHSHFKFTSELGISNFLNRCSVSKQLLSGKSIASLRAHLT